MINSNAPAIVVTPAAAQAAAVAAVQSRTAYIDILRLVLSILVIAVHAAVTYGSVGDWTYVDPMQDEISGIVLSFLVIYSQAFFMALFFFFAGLFTPGSMDRKNAFAFWKDRLLRLGIPALAYTFVLSRIPNYIDAFANEGYTGTFGQFFRATFLSGYDEGPTWFIYALFLFIGGYALLRGIGRSFPQIAAWAKQVSAPSNLLLVTTAVFISILTFGIAQFTSIDSGTDVIGTISFKLAFFPSYLVFFGAGILAYRNNWLEQWGQDVRRLWGWISLAMLITLPVLLVGGGAVDGLFDLYMRGVNWQCFAMSTWLGFACIAFSIAVTYWVKRITTGSSWLSRLAAGNNFATYIIHPLILVPVTYALSALALPGLVKFCLALTLTVPLCYLASLGLRKIPGLKSIL